MSFIVTLDMLLKFPEPQLSHMKNRLLGKYKI